MSDNQLIPIKANLPMNSSKEDEHSFLAVVNYEKIDSAHYSFSYRVDDDIEFRMDESEQASENANFVDVEFDNGIEESEKIYYSLSLASGLLTGMLCTLHLSEEQIQALDTAKEKNWKPFIIRIANIAGYKKSDYKGAARFLVNHAVKIVEKSEKTKEALTVLSEHPSLTGLVFCVISQFSKEAISITDNGVIKKQKLPKYYVIGDTTYEKIVCAFFYWLFSLGISEAISKRRVLDEMAVSANLLKKIKEFAGSSLFKNIPADYTEAEEKFSQWLEKAITCAELKEQGEQKNPFFAIMHVALNLAEESLPVVINNGIIFSIYALIRLCNEIKVKEVSSFEQLNEIPIASLLPSDNRVFSRMILIGSASFVGANIAGAAIKAIKGKKADGRGFASAFLAELNIVGIGQFLFACHEDRKYWGDDIKVLFRRQKSKTEDESSAAYCENDKSAFDPLFLDAVQARILYCLESISVQYDIAHTKRKENADKKSSWLKTWKATLLAGIGVSPELTNDYFVEDEDLLYNAIYQLAQDKSNWRWFYLLVQELALFKPYIRLGSPDDKSFKYLKLESNYVRDQFVRRQTIVSQDEVDKIIKSYLKYHGYISGSTRNAIVGIGAAAVAAVATGGLALSFAPGIAAAIAGEAVVGLHGAALTSASLAFVGGGSLAAGGLGVVGGTAIITGGGALLGLTGTGTVSAATALLQAPSEYWVRQSAKLLTYSVCVLYETLKDNLSINQIVQQIDVVLSKTEKEIASIESEKCDLDKDLIKKAKEYMKYLRKCRSELSRIIKKK